MKLPFEKNKKQGLIKYSKNTYSLFSNKIRKYQFQCDLAYAILALTPRFWNPQEANHFIRRTNFGPKSFSYLDKHLAHGLLLFLQLTENHQKDLVDCGNALEFYRNYQTEIETRNFVYAKEASDIIQTFQKNKIPAVLLKGIAYYVLSDLDYFRCRLLSDIDCLVSEDDLASAEEALHAAGYRKIEEQIVGEPHSWNFIKRAGSFDIVIDLHWTIPIIDFDFSSSRQKRSMLDRDRVKTMISGSREVVWQGLKLTVGTPENLLVHFLLHAHEDLAEQMNIVRILTAAKDLQEFCLAFPGINLLECIPSENKKTRQFAEELRHLSQSFFGTGSYEKTKQLSIPMFFYKSVSSWIDEKKYAIQIWLALTLSKRAPFVFQFCCFCLFLTQTVIDQLRRKTQ